MHKYSVTDLMMYILAVSAKKRKMGWHLVQADQGNYTIKDYGAIEFEREDHECRWRPAVAWLLGYQFTMDVNHVCVEKFTRDRDARAVADVICGFFESQEGVATQTNIDQCLKLFGLDSITHGSGSKAAEALATQLLPEWHSTRNRAFKQYMVRTMLLAMWRAHELGVELPCRVPNKS